MTSIGVGELLIIGLIGVVLLGAPLAVLVWLVMRSRTASTAPPGLAQCGACGTALAPGAEACARCGERRS